MLGALESRFWIFRDWDGVVTIDLSMTNATIAFAMLIVINPH